MTTRLMVMRNGVTEMALHPAILCWTHFSSAFGLSFTPNQRCPGFANHNLITYNGTEIFIFFFFFFCIERNGKFCSSSGRKWFHFWLWSPRWKRTTFPVVHPARKKSFLDRQHRQWMRFDSPVRWSPVSSWEVQVCWTFLLSLLKSLYSNIAFRSVIRD